MPRFIAFLLEHNATWFIARFLMASLFIAGGVAKIIDPASSLSEIQAAGLEPALFYHVAVIVTLLTGSLLILWDRYVWLGAGALSVFLVLTIILVHHFWRLPPDKATYALYVASEHIAVIGGLMAISIASHLRRLFKKWSHF